MIAPIVELATVDGQAVGFRASLGLYSLQFRARIITDVIARGDREEIAGYGACIARWIGEGVGNGSFWALMLEDLRRAYAAAR